MTLSTFTFTAIVILAAIGVLAVLIFAVWYFVFRPINRALSPKSIIKDLGDTWGESNQINKLWWFPSLYEN